MKLWKRLERTGDAQLIKDVLKAIVVLLILAFGVWATGGMELFDSLKGY